MYHPHAKRCWSSKKFNYLSSTKTDSIPFCDVRDVWNRKTWVKVTRPLWEPIELETFLSECVRRKPGFAVKQAEGSPSGVAEDEDDDGPARARRPMREARNNKRQLLSFPEERVTARKASARKSTKPAASKKQRKDVGPQVVAPAPIVTANSRPVPCKPAPKKSTKPSPTRGSPSMPQHACHEYEEDRIGARTRD